MIYINKTIELRSFGVPHISQIEIELMEGELVQFDEMKFLFAFNSAEASKDSCVFLNKSTHTSQY